MNKLAFLTLSLCCAVDLTASAENWIPAADGSPAYIDTDSIRQSEPVSTLDIRFSYPDGTVVSSLEFDRSKNTWRTAALVTRDKENKVLSAQKKEQEHDGWNPIMNGTYGKSLYTRYIETPLPPAAPQWKEIYKDGTGAVFSIDAATLRYKNGYADLWLSAVSPNEEKDFSQTIYRVRMNMAYKKVITLSATEYNYAGHIRLHAPAGGAKEDIPASSPVEKVFDYLKEEIDSGRL